MNTAIEYRYKDVPVQIHGTNRKVAYVKLSGIVVPIAFKHLRIRHAKQTARIGSRQGSNQETQEEEKG